MSYFAVFLIGLLGSVHCFGMCGGIVATLSGSGRARCVHQLAYNFGRLSTYMFLGALLGGVGRAGLLIDHLFPVQMFLYIAASTMMILMGFYLTGATRVLAVPERLGQQVWRKVQPVTRNFLPARTPKQAWLLGMCWGLMPCGMVYSVLATALVTGSAMRGAIFMLSFGLGTLPALLAGGAFASALRHFTRHRRVRWLVGVLVVVFGVMGLVNASHLGESLWSDVWCRFGTVRIHR